MSLLRAAVVLSALVAWSAPGLAEEPPPPPAKAPSPIASGVAAAASGTAAEPPKAPSAIEAVQLNRPMEVGLTIFGLTYVPCLLLGPLTEDSDLVPLMVPFAGPLITAGMANFSDAGWAIFGSLAGLQTVGAAIFAFGALLPREPTGPARPKKKNALTFRAAPFVTPTAWGASAQGSF